MSGGAGDGSARGPDWNAKYAAAEGGLFGESPNQWLRMCLARPELAPLSALFLADGDGRNGAWAAAQGLTVIGLDISSEATARAQARDRAAGVRAERIAADLRRWSPGPRRWDLSALICLQGPEALRRQGLARAVEATAPGGWLLLEGFSRISLQGPGPRGAAMRWDLDEALEWLAPAGLQLHEALQGRVLLDEGPHHQGLAGVLRLLLRRPPLG